MSTAISIAIAFSLAILSIILHELAHAYEMRRNRVEIKEIGIGIPWPRWLTFRFEDNRFFNCTVAISPLLFGAYVWNEHEYQIGILTRRSQVMIFGAGVWANYLFAVGLMALYMIFAGNFSIVSWVVLGAITATLLMKRVFCHNILPVLSIGMLLVTLFVIMDAAFFNAEVAVTEVVGGPIMIFTIAKKFAVTPLQALKFGILISLALGMTNTLPLLPLDGGKIMYALIKERSGNINIIFKVVTSVMFILLAILALTSDVVSLFK